MISRIKKLAVSGIVLSAISLPAFADRNSDVDYLAEVDSCVAELTSRLDVTDANRVRHVVTDVRRSSLGYALQIQTSVFSSTDEAKYSVYCVANGNHAPIKFRLKELQS